MEAKSHKSNNVTHEILNTAIPTKMLNRKRIPTAKPLVPRRKPSN